MTTTATALDHLPPDVRDVAWLPLAQQLDCECMLGWRDFPVGLARAKANAHGMAQQPRGANSKTYLAL